MALPENEGLRKINLTIPVGLKKFLLEDWDTVTKKEKVIPLPRRPNVVQILEQFVVKHRRELQSSADEVVQGVRTYFQQALRPILLYTIEREDIVAVLDARGGDPAVLLGAEHLLRLFVKLPDILPTGGLSEDARGALEGALNLLLTFLDKNRRAFFTLPKDYRPMGTPADQDPAADQDPVAEAAPGPSSAAGGGANGNEAVKTEEATGATGGTADEGGEGNDEAEGGEEREKSGSEMTD